MNKGKNILICPLEWGLGHAARMIPLAKRLQELNNNIFIGSGEEHLALFRAELSGLTYINFSGFKPGYSRYFPQYLVLLVKTPYLLYHIIREHIKLKRIIRDYSIDIVISDNRFGLWNKKVTSVYITHMPLIPLPRTLRLLELFGVIIHRAVIRKYSFCFIPDLPGEMNVSGRLSHGVRLTENVRYIGILSRFTSPDAPEPENGTKFRHNTLILSGPEPQRSILKMKLTNILKGKEPPTVILEGKPGNLNETSASENILCYSHLAEPEMKKMIIDSECIISRSGYTTIMDLLSLNRTALLIPTPGQTEQEYLADYLSEKSWFRTIKQSKLEPGFSLTGAKVLWPENITEMSRILLAKALEELLNQDQKTS